MEKAQGRHWEEHKSPRHMNRGAMRHWRVREGFWESRMLNRNRFVPAGTWAGASGQRERPVQRLRKDKQPDGNDGGTGEGMEQRRTQSCYEDQSRWARWHRRAVGF